MRTSENAVKGKFAQFTFQALEPIAYDMRNPLQRRGMSSLFKRLLREVFRHHSNPWSAWTRLLSVPLVFLPIWNRSWREGAIVVVWLIVNPIMFREPKNDKAWATRAMLGEEMWITKRPLDRAMALNVGATAFGLGGVWGAYKRRLLPTALCTVGQMGLLLAYWREMVVYYERHRGEGE